MIGMYLVMAFFGLVFFVGFPFVIWWKVTEWRQFEQRDKNPFRRYCTDCGAQHNYFTWHDHDLTKGWWECMDEGCPNCRRYTRKVLAGW